MCASTWQFSFNTFVDFEHSLNAAIKRLRDALDDSAAQRRFIETVPHRGHRFVAPVRRVDGNPAGRVPVRRHTVAAVAAVALFASALAGWQLTRRAQPHRPATSQDRAIAPAAHGAYLQGLHASRRWQAGGCVAAERHLLEAIAIDPNAALAHVVQGRIHLHDEFDWAAAEREFRKALELNPGESQALVAYGEWLYASGRAEAGLASIRDALRVDVLNMDHQTGYGFALRNLRRFDEAAEQFHRTVEEDPEWAIARFWLASTQADRGQQRLAVAEYLAFLARVVVPARADGVGRELARLYDERGRLAFWRAELALAEEDNRAPGSLWIAPASYYSCPFSMARRYARLGDRAATLDWLDKAFAYRHHLMVFIALEPLFDPLHDEPRFPALERRMRLVRPVRPA